jgi:hypothetical protein
MFRSLTQFPETLPLVHNKRVTCRWKYIMSVIISTASLV